MRNRKSQNMLLAMSLVACGPIPAAPQDLDANEARSTDLSRQWRERHGVVTQGGDGRIMFLFGEIQPTIVCSPLQVCDIELEAGEIVRDVLIGDTVRWKVQPATSGPAENQAVHLIVKPAETGLVTSMVVTTSRRSYHLELRSHLSEYMARVGFHYPDAVQISMAEINRRMQARALPGADIPAERLDFGFRWSGRAGWRPTRIYSDGEKTYIQFPASLSGMDAPVLFVVSDGENRIVNYRMKGSLMVVDYHIDKAILVSGVGYRQRKITIRRGG